MEKKLEREERDRKIRSKYFWKESFYPKETMNEKEKEIKRKLSLRLLSLKGREKENRQRLKVETKNFISLDG